jgi:hypothetical protein
MNVVVGEDRVKAATKEGEPRSSPAKAKDSNLNSANWS